MVVSMGKCSICGREKGDAIFFTEGGCPECGQVDDVPPPYVDDTYTMIHDRDMDQIIWILLIVTNGEIGLVNRPIHLNLESVHENAKSIIESMGLDYSPSKWEEAAHNPTVNYPRPADSLEYREPGKGVILRAIGDWPMVVRKERSVVEEFNVPDKESTIQRSLNGFPPVEES